jgi:hypothetical protein
MKKYIFNQQISTKMVQIFHIIPIHMLDLKREMQIIKLQILYLPYQLIF